MPEPRTLRPGLLVGLKSSLDGGVTYRKKPLDRYVDDTGAEVVIWDTVRVTVDPVEHAEGIKVRTAARGRILRVVQLTDFGYMCPESERERLNDEIKRAREIAAEFNARAKTTRINIRVMVGRIAADDVQAVEAITEQVRKLLADMQAGLQRFDVSEIRKAANEAQQLGEMLTDDARGKLQVAIDAARKSARRIVKAGETAAREIDRQALASIDTARVAFLDFAVADGGEIEMTAPVMDAVGMDFAPIVEANAVPAVAAPVVSVIDMDWSL